MSFTPITSRDIEVLHDTVIDLTGGTRGVLNRGNLESCADRILGGFFGFSQYADIYSKAAALMECVAKWHAFADGNKRTSVQAVHLLLDYNGVKFKPNDETVGMCLKIAKCEHDLEEVQQWIERCSSPK